MSSVLYIYKFLILILQLNNVTIRANCISTVNYIYKIMGGLVMLYELRYQAQEISVE